MTIEENIKKQNILLPEAPNPVGAYLAYKKTGSLVYISGQISLMANGKLIKGKIGSELTLDQGIEAAQVCAINIISQVKSACQGDLENVKNCIKITGFVNSSDNFIDQPKVINGASELLVRIFEEKGTHARAAVSVNSLPLGAAVEVEAVFEIN